MSDRPPGVTGPVGTPKGSVRAPKAWNTMLVALVHDLPKSLNDATRLRQAMLRKRRIR